MAKHQKANPNAKGRHTRKRKLGVGKPLGEPATWWNSTGKAFFQSFDRSRSVT